MENKRKGISLIVLIITIIVIIILAGAVILNLSKNNPIDSARKAKFVNDIDTFKSELSLYELNKMSSSTGSYDPKTLNATKDTMHENGNEVLNSNIITVISSMKGTDYDSKLEIIAGELVYVGDSEKESNWVDGIIESKNFKINVTTIPDMDNIQGKITLTGYLVDEKKIQYYRVYISTSNTTFSETPDKEITDQSKEVTFNLNNLIPNKEYYIKVELKMENESSPRVVITDKIITKADTIVPLTPSIVIPAYSNSYTIYPVTVTMSDNEGGSGISKENSRYIIDQISTNYAEDNNIWQAGSTKFNLDNFVENTATLTLNLESDGEYYVHVLAVDNAGNKKASVSSKVKVDTIVPNEAEITVPSTSTNNSIQATVKMSDNEGGSGLNISECKYIYSSASSPYGDTESIWDTATAFTSETQTITVESSTNDIYYLHVLLVDKAGNRREVLSSGVTTNTTTPVAPVITGTVASNAWTNNNAVITINEVASPGIVKYEYNINDGAWQTYNSANKITVSNEGTTYVKARAVNNVGVNGAESTGYVVNIDKQVPTVVFGTNGASNVQVAGTTVAISDLGGSTVDDTTLQYVWATQNTTEPTSGWQTFTNGAAITKTGTTGTYYLWVKGKDKAGNSVVGKTNGFVMDNVAPTDPVITPSTTAWTNGNVTITITYPSDATVKQYSLDGTNWTNYTAAIAVSTNNTTVYAKGKDASGNQSSTSSLTVTNIDKTAPSIPTVNLNGYTAGTWTTGNITLNLSSTDSQSGINRYQWSGDGINWTDFQSSWVYNYDTWQAPSFRAIDNAGNASGATSYYSIQRDATAPTYSSYAITNVTSTGYDVYLYGVADSTSGVNRVQFPTWTDYNGQDDLLSDWQTNSSATGQNLGNGTWYFRVNKSAHNNESGQYQTHVYLFDNVGNVSGFYTSGAVVPTSINYGTSIQNTYSSLYLSNSPTTAFNNSYHDYDKLYNGNFYQSNALLETMKVLGGEMISPNTSRVDGSSYVYVNSGENAITLNRSGNANRWFLIKVWAGGMTTGVSVGNFRIRFADGSVLNPEQAVANGYIEPLVVLTSGAYSTAYNGLWTNFIGLKNGGTTSSQNYPMGNIIFKTKNKSLITGINIYSSRAFNSSYDGIYVFECTNTTELSTTAF